MKLAIGAVLAIVGSAVVHAFWPDLLGWLSVDADTVPAALRGPSAIAVGIFILMLFMPIRDNRSRTMTGVFRPKEGEYWMGRVPYADGTGGKDRPCLILNVDKFVCDALYITSQDKSQDRCYVQIDNSQWSGRLRSRDSWMRIAQRDGSSPTVQVPMQNLRRRLGRVSAQDSADLEQHGISIR